MLLLGGTTVAVVYGLFSIGRALGSRLRRVDGLWRERGAKERGEQDRHPHGRSRRRRKDGAAYKQCSRAEDESDDFQIPIIK